MPIRVATLRVFANPWTYIDEHGRPMGVCMVDVNEHVNERRWVGAHLGAEMLEKAQVQVVKGRENEVAPARHKLHLEVTKDESGNPMPVELPNTAYYRERIRCGELFAADLQTASVAGLNQFVAVADAEAKAREEAIKTWAAENGSAPPFEFTAPFFSAPKAVLTATKLKGDS